MSNTAIGQNMIAYKTVLEEGDRIDVHDHPYPTIVKHPRMVSHELTDILMQRFGARSF